MDKVIAYCGTANLYKVMYLSLRTMLERNAIDRVYLIIEDDQFPYPLPKNVQIINFYPLRTNFFPKGSYVYGVGLTYMAFARLTLSQLLPMETYVLYLDCDTIIKDNIEEIFSIDLSNYCFGAVQEKYSSIGRQKFINSGVLLLNLARLRATHLDDKLIRLSNEHCWSCADQDVINTTINTEIKYIPAQYNSFGLCWQSDKDGPAKIQHFASDTPIQYYRHFIPYGYKYLPGVPLHPATWTKPKPGVPE